MPQIPLLVALTDGSLTFLFMRMYPFSPQVGPHEFFTM